MPKTKSDAVPEEKPVVEPVPVPWNDAAKTFVAEVEALPGLDADIKASCVARARAVIELIPPSDRFIKTVLPNVTDEEHVRYMADLVKEVLSD